MAFYETVDMSERFEKTYKRATKQLQEQVDDTVKQLIENPKLPGLRVKPIKHAGYYYEARINSGDRLIFRAEGKSLFLINFVKHDNIGDYGAAPKRSR